LVFTDRLLVTLVHLRTGLTHEALGVIYQVGSSTIGQAIGEITPLLAERGFAVPQRPGLRLRDVFAYAEAKNVTLRIDGTETPGPSAGRTPRTGRLRLRQAQAERDQDHHHQRRPRTHPVVRGGAAGPDARPDRDAHRGHR
jgi:hypothetical protein